MLWIYLIAVFLITICAQDVPEKYGWACYNVAANKNWPQCANVSKFQKKACLCQIPEFIALTESCLLEAVINDTNPTSAIEYARSESMCRVDTELMREEIALIRSRQQEATGTKNIITDKELTVVLSTAEWRINNDRISQNAGAALMGFWGTLLVIRYMAHIATLYAPRRIITAIAVFTPVRYLRSRLLNMPLGRKSHSRPVDKLMGIYLPTRAFSFCIILFLILNYCLMFIGYPYEPKNFMFTTSRQQWCKSLAIRSGFMIVWKLPLLFCFSGRNNIFLLFGHPWAMDTFNTFHRWIARIMIIDVVIHAVSISIVKSDQGLYNFMWHVPYWRWGVVTAVLSCLLVTHSIRFLAHRHYEVFKVIHVLLAILFLVGAWYHVKILPYGKNHLYSVFAIWGFDYVARWTRIIVARNAEATIEHVNPSLTVIRISSPSIYTWAMRREARFLFLHIGPWYKLWQSHPFTIVRDWKMGESEQPQIPASLELKQKVYHSIQSSVSSSSKQESVTDFNDGRLVAAVQHRSGITEDIAKMKEGKVKIALDGPYGSYIPLHRFQKILFIAGGVGITAHLSHIQLLLTKTFKRPLDLKLCWAAKTLYEMESLMDAIAYLSFQVEVTVYSPDLSSARRWSKYPIKFRDSRLNCKAFIKSEIADADANGYQCSTAIYSCGPGSLNDDARLAACWAMEHSCSYVEFYEEVFGS